MKAVGCIERNEHLGLIYRLGTTECQQLCSLQQSHRRTVDDSGHGQVDSGHGQVNQALALLTTGTALKTGRVAIPFRTEASARKAGHTYSRQSENHPPVFEVVV